MIEDNNYVYILSKYKFYVCDEIIMISLSYGEIIGHFNQELKLLSSGYGLLVRRCMLGKKSMGKHIRWVERKNGEIVDLMSIM